MKEKLKKLQDWLSENQIQLAYLHAPKTIQYFSGFESEPHERVLALFVPQKGEPFLFTPGLEVEDAQNCGWPYDVVGYLDSEDPWTLIQHKIQKSYGDIQSLAVEKNALTVDRLEAVQHILPKLERLEDLTSYVQQAQLIKTEAEKNILMEAGKWADRAFEIGFQALKAGVSEQEVVAEIEYQLKKLGVSHMSFDTLVLFGAHAASPHGNPSDVQLKQNELALFDLGVVWKGYCSDATRTVSYHEPTAQQRKIYDIVLEAQLAAMNAVRPGILASELDKIARDIISSYGYGEYFNHRLGHGIGTTVHEFPSLVEGNDMVIQEGMCFSIEPGIYIPDEVGVRIEDCVYVTKNGCESFTHTPKELLIIE